MKKLFALLLVVVMLLPCLVACDGAGEQCDHDWDDWEITKEATCTESGRKVRKCDECGEKEKKDIKKTGHEYVDGVCIACGALDEGGNIEMPTTAPTEYPTETPTEWIPDDDNTSSTDRTFIEKNDIVYTMAASGAANLRTDTTYVTSSVAVFVKNGVELERIAVESNNAWSKVKYEGKEYFISNNVIAEKAILDGFEETSKTIKITAESINVRFVPQRTTDSPIGEFLKGAEVEVVAFNPNLGEQGWYKIKLTRSEDQPHEYGYISANRDYSEEVVSSPTVGYEVGQLCPEMTLATYSGSSFNISQTKGKVTVINFWGTWCTPCVQELPHFNDITNEYTGSVAVVAIHSALDSETGGDYINENFPGTKMIIAKDTYNDDYFKALGGAFAYPMTLVLDADGIVVWRTEGTLTYDHIRNAVETALAR